MSDNPKSVKEASVEESENAETEGPSLIQTIYASRASEAFVEGELAGLMEQSRSNNLRGELTGMLLYCEGSFFQVLEGEEEAVRSVYRSIEKDPRHEDMVKIKQFPHSPTCLRRRSAKTAVGEKTFDVY